MAMTQGVSGSFDIVSSSNSSFTARVFYSEQYDSGTGKHIVSITDIQIQSTTYGNTWYPGGTVSIDGETVGTMSYSAPATHKVALTAGSSWFSIVPYQDGAAFPWESSEISGDADGSKTVVIAIDMLLYRDSTHTAKFAGSASVELTRDESGLVYIDNGSSIDAYAAYIDNGTSWDRCCAFIDSGSGWETCN